MGITLAQQSDAPASAADSSGRYADLLTDDDLKRAPAKEPAKRWRNKYRTTGIVRDVHAQVLLGPGEFWGANIWPSEDVARTRAELLVEKLITAGHAAVHLGAFPVESEST